MRPYLMAATAAAAMCLASGVGAAPTTGLTGAPGARYVELVQAAGSQATVRVKSAILRAGPDTKSKKLASLPRGTKLQVMGGSGDWTQVRAGNREGYVSSSLLR